MPHPAIDNDTPLIVEPLFLEDESGRPTLTVVVKATFDIDIGAHGLALAAVQRPLAAAGEFWADPAQPNPDLASYRFEPEVTPIKLATDVAVVGNAHAQKPRTTEMNVAVRVGPVQKGLRVFGERKWYALPGGGAALSKPLPFERMPINYERAFGGWDRSAPDPKAHVCERRNPAGRGFHDSRTAPTDNDYAPNIEDPSDLIRDYRDRPTPAGFGFTLPGWVPRTELAGTYDAKWVEERRPLLPTDFDPRFFNGASAGLVAPGHLVGDEPVQALGLRPEGDVSFNLPGIPPPEVRISLLARSDATPALVLDTVILDMDALQLLLLWRARVRIASGPADLRALEVRSKAANTFPRRELAAPANGA